MSPSIDRSGEIPYPIFLGSAKRWAQTCIDQFDELPHPIFLGSVKCWAQSYMSLANYYIPHSWAQLSTNLKHVWFLQTTRPNILGSINCWTQVRVALTILSCSILNHENILMSQRSFSMWCVIDIFSLMS